LSSGGVLRSHVCHAPPHRHERRGICRRTPTTI
jgi:hypothetical protein